MSLNDASRRDTCSVRSLATLAAALDNWGYDVPKILSAGKVEIDQMDDIDNRISLDAYRSVWEAARKTTGDEAIGLHVLADFDPRHLMTVFVYLASSSATAREAFERVAPFIRIANDAVEVELSEVEGRTIFRSHFRGFEQDHYMTEFFIGLIVKVAPFVLGTHDIQEAWFSYSPPAYADEYKKILGVDIRFDAPCNAVLGSADGLDRPLPNADEVLCAMLQQQAVAALKRLPMASDFAQIARRQIESQIQDGDVSAEAVASALGLSDRTLRRRLKDCGVRYQELLDNVRCDLARQALARPGTSVGEVAFSLGFSDTSAFHKAFRRWTGTKPSDWANSAR